MDIIDLHTHTTASDGTLEPSEIVRHAYEAGLTAIAVTDHDTVDGIPEALDEAKRTGLKVIPGVEISVSFRNELHILGYFDESAYQRIDAILQLLRRHRDERNPRIIAKLNAMGMDITMKEADREAGGRIIGRPHIARVLVVKKYAKDIEDAFERFLSPGRPAYIGKEKLIPAEGIKAITECGGVPVLAHPSLSFDSYSELRDFVGEAKEHGLQGIEAYYPSHNDEQTSCYIDIAEKHGMIVTGGTDFHGENRKEIRIGVGGGDFRVPVALLPKLEEAIASVKGKRFMHGNRESQTDSAE